jgi:Tol biopolymer transport system component
MLSGNVESVNPQTGEVTNWGINGTHAGISSSGEWIAYASEEPHATLVWVSNGADVWKIAELPIGPNSVVGRLVWSDDDQQIAFLVTFTEEPFREQLAVLDVGTGTWQLITGPATAFAWRPDSQQIAVFPAGIDSGIGLYLIDPIQDVWHRMVRQVHISEMVWSPDGDQIAFVTSDTAYTSQLLTVYDVTDRTQNLVYSDTNYFDGLAWSPDGESITLRTETEDLVLVDLAATKSDLIGNQLCCCSATWSPDGKHIAYLRKSQRTSSPSLVVHDTELGSDRVLVLEASPTVDALVWR